MRKNQTNDELERVLLTSGYKSVIGVDEVGRGSWAGPVVVAAFIYSVNSQIISQVNDSKALTKKRRESLSAQLKRNSYSIGMAEKDEIDELNVLEATRLAIVRALKDIDTEESIVLLDGYFRDPFEFEYKCIQHGDAKHYSIAAASVIAKVYRDNLLAEYGKTYPVYGFESNAGYGTKKHMEALKIYGICDIHRLSYKPIKKILHGR